MSGRPRPGKSANGRAFKMTHQPMEEGWLTTFEEVTDQRAAEARMVHLAHHDALTDLPNRVLFRQKLEHALAYARQGGSLALLFLDLDQFKAVNDTLGHPVGDELLQAVAERLVGQLRETDTVARLGGDEFAIVQSRIEKPTEATAFASRLIELLEAPFEVAWPSDRHRHQYRHCLRAAGRHGCRPVAAQRRPRAVSRQVGRPRRLSAVPRRDGCTDAGAAPAGARSAAGAAMRTARSVLPAADQCARPGRRRVRGAAALAASAARHRPAERVHPAGRGDRPDRADRRVGAATGLHRCRLLAWHAEGRGQSLAGAVQKPRSGGCRGCRIERIGAATRPARAGDHRNRDAGGHRRDGGDTARAARARRPHRHGRFRHRLFLAELSAELPVRPHQDRPVIRSRTRPCGRTAARSCARWPASAASSA